MIYRRSLTSTDAGKRVQKTWEFLLERKIESAEGSVEVSCDDLVSSVGLMFRSCFTFDWFGKMQTVDDNLNSVVEMLNSLESFCTRPKVSKLVGLYMIKYRFDTSFFFTVKGREAQKL